MATSLNSLILAGEAKPSGGGGDGGGGGGGVGGVEEEHNPFRYDLVISHPSSGLPSPSSGCPFSWGNKKTQLLGTLSFEPFVYSISPAYQTAALPGAPA